MKTIILVVFAFVVACNSQPNTSTIIDVGIVNPQPDKTYLVFAELKPDTLSSRLIDGMDYLAPDVSDLMLIISNWTLIGDTLFGEIIYNDLTYVRFVKGGLVQVNDFNNKYSAMAVSYWNELDMVEPNAGFLFRRRN
jgi:hypothetical protein